MNNQSHTITRLAKVSFFRGFAGMITLLILLVSCENPLFKPFIRTNPNDPAYEASKDPDNADNLTPVAPGRLRAVILSTGTDINLTWQDNSDFETGYRIYRRLGTSGSFERIADKAQSDLTAYTDGTVTEGASYYYTVAAYNASGEGERSNVALAAAGLPEPFITCSIDSPTKQSIIPITITFSDSVIGLKTEDISVTNGSAGAVSTSDNTVFNTTIIPDVEGIVRVQIPAGITASEATEKENTASEIFQIEYDISPPAVVIESSMGSVTATDILYEVTFNEEISGLTASDFDITGAGDGAIISLNNNSVENYELTIEPALDPATISVMLPAGKVADVAGNENTASNIQEIRYDTSVLTVELSSPEGSPTNLYSIPLTITFSDTTTGFTIDDITCSGGTVSNFSGSGIEYTVTITPSGDGVITVSVPEAVAQDSHGKENAASGTFTIESDRTAPDSPSTPDFSASDDTGTSNTDNLTNKTTDLTFTGSAEINSTVFLYNGTDGIGSSTVDSSGNWTITADIGAGAHSITAKAQDAAGNMSGSSNSLPVVIDTDAPSGSILIDNGNEYTTDTSVDLTINAEDTNGADVYQMEINNSGVFSADWEPYADNKNSWNIDSDEGNQKVYIRFSDTAGNVTETEISDSIILDTVAPTGSFTINGGKTHTNSTDITINITANDSGTGVTDILYSLNSNYSGASWASFSTKKSLTLNSTEAEYTVYVRIRDGAGRTTDLTTQSIILDQTPPGQTIIIAPYYDEYFPLRYTSGYTGDLVDNWDGSKSRIEWQSVADADKYYIEVASDSSFDTLIINELTDTTYYDDISSDIEYNAGAYWIRIHSEDQAGNLTEGEARRFFWGVPMDDFDGTVHTIEGYTFKSADLVFTTSGGSVRLVFGGQSPSVDSTEVTLPAGAGTELVAAFIGDCNGDGAGDLAIGDYANESVYIYYGDNTGSPDFAADQTLTISTGENFGSAVSPAGDINGDGYADMVVSKQMPEEVYDDGGAFIFYGSSGGFGDTTSDYDTITDSANTGGNYAEAVSFAGDLNRDGYPDIALGTPQYTDDTNSRYSAVAIYYGGKTDMNLTEADTYISGNSSYDCGTYISGGGDIDGDGYDDLVYNSENDAYVFWGVDGTSTGTGKTVQYPGNVELVQDFNDDGYDDITTIDFYGRNAAIIYGNYDFKTEGTHSAQNLPAPSTTGYAYRDSLASVGDFNMDGLGDFAINVYDDSTGGSSDYEEIYFFYGTDSDIAGENLSITGTGYGKVLD